MKKLIFYISILGLLISAGCERFEIEYSKYGEAIDPVTNLTTSISGNELTVSWTLPSSYPDDIIQPVSIDLTIDDGGRRPFRAVLGDAPGSFVYDRYNPDGSYKVIVKVQGNVMEQSKPVAKYRLSLGQTVYL